MHWTLPYPFETHEILLLAESGSILIGDVSALPLSGLRDAELLTADGYVVDVRLMAQYRVRDIAQYFSTQAQDVELVLKQSGASALREVVGRMELAEIVGGKPEQIIGRVRLQWQAALDGVQSGIEITNLSAGPDAVQAPEALKAVYAEVEKVRQDKAQAAEQAADTLRQIKDGAQSTLDRVREVAESTKEQSVASDSIAQKVEEIATMVEETTAAMHATAQTAEDLERISGELNALVTRFRC